MPCCLCWPAMLHRGHVGAKLASGHGTTMNGHPFGIVSTPDTGAARVRIAAPAGLERSSTLNGVGDSRRVILRRKRITTPLSPAAARCAARDEPGKTCSSGRPAASHRLACVSPRGNRASRRRGDIHTRRAVQAPNCPKTTRLPVRVKPQHEKKRRLSVPARSLPAAASGRINRSAGHAADPGIGLPRPVLRSSTSPDVRAPPIVPACCFSAAFPRGLLPRSPYPSAQEHVTTRVAVLQAPSAMPTVRVTPPL